MSDWNTLFDKEKAIRRIPESIILLFIKILENNFKERPLKIWDLCCGAGRHTVALAGLGHEIYASDVSPNGVNLTQEWLTKNKLTAFTEVADMTSFPWNDKQFHGVFSWAALHHNTLSNIQQAVDLAFDQLLPGGLFLCNLISTKSDSFGHGELVEEGTFIHNFGWEEGVKHHYFNEKEIRKLFDKWEFLSLNEQVNNYLERAENFYEINPFPYTKWLILAKKP